MRSYKRESCKSVNLRSIRDFIKLDQAILIMRYKCSKAVAKSVSQETDELTLFLLSDKVL